MIYEFESVLQENGGVSCTGINAAIDSVVKKYQEDAAMLLCPYISRRIGIAEWIVRCDMRQRYTVKKSLDVNVV